MELLRLRHRGVGGRECRTVVIVIAICALTLSVATRFWAPCTGQSHVAKSIDRQSVDPKRQHLDRDAARWVAPSASFNFVAPATVEARLAPAGPLLPKLVLSDSLYNRPTPFSAFFF